MMDIFQENPSFPQPMSKDFIQVHAKSILDELLCTFNDKKIGLKKISTKTGIHERTLSRLLNLENRPNYQTLLRLYKCYFNEYNETDLVNLLPHEIQIYLKKFTVSQPTQELRFDNNIDKKIQENPILAEIYILAGTGPFNSEEIKLRFGQYGLNLLGEMVQEKILIKAEENVFILGNNQANFDIPTILKSGLVMAKNHFNTINAYELDKNHIGFLAEGLTPEEYHQWLAIDQEAHLKKVQIINNKKTHGNIRAFTFMVTDTISILENI